MYRADSATSRLRVVFNASSHSTNGKSLNDQLLSGPKLQLDLPSIIMQWRQFRYVYTADIAKTYRQILIDSRDLDYQRNLCQSEHATTPCEYQLLTVTYGMMCAPFLLRYAFLNIFWTTRENDSLSPVQLFESKFTLMISCSGTTT